MTDVNFDCNLNKLFVLFHAHFRSHFIIRDDVHAVNGMAKVTAILASQLQAAQANPAA